MGMTVALVLLVLGLTGCTNNSFTRLGFPNPITEQGKTVLTLWQGSWIAGFAVGVLVWGLILWAVIFHRKRGDKLPPQARYNMPIEIMYTAVPFVLIAVLFYFTAKDENYIDKLSSKPDVVVNVLGFRWSWQFNYPQYHVTNTGNMWGDGPLPVLEIPTGETVRFNLTSDGRGPRVLDPRVPVQAGRHPRSPEPLRGHADPDGDLHRALQRVVRPVPQQDVVYREGREPAAVPGRHDRRAGGTGIIREHPVSTIEQPVIAAPQRSAGRRGSILAAWLSSTDHKIIGHLYLITSFFFFLCAGVMALLMRIQLLGPDQHFVSDQQYNELFTMHGILMLLLFATPLFVGFANEIMPLQIGAPDVAFPRMNILSYWFFLFGGLILLASFLTPGGAASFGWYAYSPLSSAIYSPGVGADMWIMGLVLSGLGTILSGVNFITTIFCMRAPGMTMFRMPNAVHVAPKAVKIVEAVVLFVNDDDVIVLVE